MRARGRLGSVVCVGDLSGGSGDGGGVTAAAQRRKPAPQPGGVAGGGDARWQPPRGAAPAAERAAEPWRVETGRLMGGVVEVGGGGGVEGGGDGVTQQRAPPRLPPAAPPPHRHQRHTAIELEQRRRRSSPAAQRRAETRAPTPLHHHRRGRSDGACRVPRAVGRPPQPSHDEGQAGAPRALLGRLRQACRAGRARRTQHQRAPPAACQTRPSPSVERRLLEAHVLTPPRQPGRLRLGRPHQQCRLLRRPPPRQVGMARLRRAPPPCEAMEPRQPRRPLHRRGTCAALRRPPPPRAQRPPCARRPQRERRPLCPASPHRHATPPPHHRHRRAPLCALAQQPRHARIAGAPMPPTQRRPAAGAPRGLRPPLAPCPRCGRRVQRTEGTPGATQRRRRRRRIERRRHRPGAERRHLPRQPRSTELPCHPPAQRRVRRRLDDAPARRLAPPPCHRVAPALRLHALVLLCRAQHRTAHPARPRPRAQLPLPRRTRQLHAATRRRCAANQPPRPTHRPPLVPAARAHAHAARAGGQHRRLRPPWPARLSPPQQGFPAPPQPRPAAVRGGGTVPGRCAACARVPTCERACGAANVGRGDGARCV